MVPCIGGAGLQRRKKKSEEARDRGRFGVDAHPACIFAKDVVSCACLLNEVYCACAKDWYGEVVSGRTGSAKGLPIP